MYKGTNNDGVEQVCYEQAHVEKVLAAIKKNFDAYFDRFLDAAGGNELSLADIQDLQKKFGIEIQKNKKNFDPAQRYGSILREAVDEFEKDRESYQKIFNQSALEDLDEDADFFKLKILKNECPVIRKTLANKKAKELDPYRVNFSLADADLLLRVVYNLCVFADDYIENYDADEYESVQTYQELALEPLAADEYTVYGVIGGGIKSHMLFKVYPAVFPNRSRSAIWALWYLTNKETFGCKTDSEFLMIDVGKTVTQQNYFYPYRLFAYYAFEIYKLLRDKAAALGVVIDTDYRYVIVDAFLEYVAAEHQKDIDLLQSQIKDGGMSYA